MMHLPTPARAGRMTAVMRAVNAPAPAEKILRVATLLGGSIVDERLVRDGSVAIGELASFERTRAGYRLRWSRGAKGRVATSGAVIELSGEGSIALDADARGKITVGVETVLFQLVAPPPPQAKPRLPLGVRTAPAIDWRLTIIAALSFLAHFGFVGTMYSDWTDVPVEEGAWVQGLVDMSRTMPPAPVEDRATEPAPAKHPAQPSNTSNSPSASPAQATHAATGDPAAHAAALSQRAEAMQVELLAAFGGTTAVQDALRRSNIPTPDLDEAARSPGGVERGSDLKLSHGGALVNPGGRHDLSQLGVTDRGPEHAGTLRVVDAPTVANLEPITGPPGVVHDADGVVAGLRPGFRSCYNKGVARDPGMQGKIVMSVKIAANGEVVSVEKVDGSGLDEGVESCVMGKMKGASFAPPGPSGATLRVPASFLTLAKK